MHKELKNFWLARLEVKKRISKIEMKIKDPYIPSVYKAVGATGSIGNQGNGGTMGIWPSGSNGNSGIKPTGTLKLPGHP